MVEVTTAGSTVAVRLTEVEAYHGLGTGAVPDPGSHARMGRTARNATMWGEPGHLYVYLSHGIHSCVNVVCGPEGTAGGILLRAGEVIATLDPVDAGQQRALSAAQLARDAALVDLDNIRQVSGTRRAELVSQLDPDLVALYEKVRAGGGQQVNAAGVEELTEQSRVPGVGGSGVR